jgi:hypothetical protein
VLGLIAAAATVYGQYSSVQERRAEIARQNEIRNHLGSLISREDGLLALLRDPSQPFPATSGNAWASEAETYLKESLGPGYVDRFRDSSGMLHGSPVGLDTERLGYWNGIYERVARLQQFSGEVSH